MSLRQLNASYIADEDRVLMRLSTTRGEEYRLWLTRAITGQLQRELQQLALQQVQRSPNTQQASLAQASEVDQIRQQALAQSATYTQFEPSSHLPLGAEPVLVKSVQLRPLDGQRHALRLTLHGARELTLPLSEELIGKFRLILQRMNTSAHWLLPEPSGAAAPTADSAHANPTTLADGDDSDQPGSPEPGARTRHLLH